MDKLQCAKLKFVQNSRKFINTIKSNYFFIVDNFSRVWKCFFVLQWVETLCQCSNRNCSHTSMHYFSLEAFISHSILPNPELVNWIIVLVDLSIRFNSQQSWIILTKTVSLLDAIESIKYSLRFYCNRKAHIFVFGKAKKSMASKDLWVLFTVEIAYF